MTIVDHGIPVVSSRQWTTALSPNAEETGWNYIVASWTGATDPIEWVVLGNLTVAPTPAIYETTTHDYPNSNIQYNNQLRAQNGRIFFPGFGPSMNYYDPDTEEVVELGKFVETPPVNPDASTIFFAAQFDTSGMLYLSTQESQNRQTCIVSLDPDTLEYTTLGYVGEDAIGGTTYGYYLAPDTATATKFLYVAYGQNPWQLWAIDLTPGPTYGDQTKLFEVPATGFISFSAYAGKGWRVNIASNLGDPSNVQTTKWLIDGVMYDWVDGGTPPNPRDVIGASNPLVDAPELDITGGVGVIGWRAGSSGPYTYVNYDVNYYLPVPIEALVASNDGIAGNAQSYLGHFQYDESDETLTWFGPWSGSISRGPRLNVSGTIYMAGYPNGVMWSYDPDAAWNPTTNPTLLGYVGLNGTQYAGIKYSDHMAWAPLAGTAGRLFVVGSRERNGVGAGIGSWDKHTGLLDGTWQETDMDTVVPAGVVVLGNLGYVVMSTTLIDGPGTAKLFVFDYSFNVIGILPVIADIESLGPIFETTTPNVIAGIVQGAGSSLGIWQYNVETETFVDYVETAVIGSPNLDTCQVALRPGGTVWLMSGNNLVSVDPSAMTAEVIQSLASIAPVTRLAFGSDPSVLYVAAGTESVYASGARLYSIALGDTLAFGSFEGIGEVSAITFDASGAQSLTWGAFEGIGLVYSIALSGSFDVGGDIGANEVTLVNGESTPITRGQPVYSDADGSVRLAVADGTAAGIIAGLVASSSARPGFPVVTRLTSSISANADEWDAVCGTAGGLEFGTTYYLHPATPGRLTATAPTASGKAVIPVIRAISPTTAVIATTRPILL